MGHGPPRRDRIVTASRPDGTPDTAADSCCAPGNLCPGNPPARQPGDARWLRDTRAARWLAWASLAWMCTEGGVGLWQGLGSGSAALTGWALGSAAEGLASIVVIWRFTGARALSEDAERRAQRAVAVTFWLLAPYIAVESGRDLAAGHHAEATVIGMALTAAPQPGPQAGGPTLSSGWPSPPPLHGRESSSGAEMSAADRRPARQKQPGEPAHGNSAALPHSSAGHANTPGIAHAPPRNCTSPGSHASQRAPESRWQRVSRFFQAGYASGALS